MLSSSRTLAQSQRLHARRKFVYFQSTLLSNDECERLLAESQALDTYAKVGPGPHPLTKVIGSEEQAGCLLGNPLAACAN